MTERTVAVKLVGRTDQYVRAMSDANRATGRFTSDSSRSLSMLGSQLATLGAGAGIGVFLKNSIDAASDLNESVNAVSVTYKQNADAVLAIGENSAKSFGLASSEFNQFAVQFSAFAQTVAGGSGQSVDKVLGNLTGRVADFASVMNLDLGEATQVFMSALAGETEPIRRYGKDLSAANVEQFALAHNLIESKNELTEQIKVQARYGLLMQQTADVQGDFANTSGELANSQRIARAEFKNFTAQIGTELMPVLRDATQLFATLIGTAETLHLPDLFSAPNRLFEGARNWGETTRAIFTEFSLETKNNKIVRLFEEGNDAAAKFDMGLLKGLDTFEQVRAKVIDLTDSESAANQVALEWANTNGLLAGQSISQKQAVEAQAVTVKSLADQSETYVRLLEGRYATAMAEQAAATNRARTANALYVESIKTQRDELQHAIDSQFDYELATMRVADAQDRLKGALTDQTRLLTEGTVSAEAKAAAAQRIVDAETEARAAAVGLTDAYAAQQRMLAESVATDEQKAKALRKVEDAQRGVEDATRAAQRAQRDLADSQRDLADLRTELGLLDFTQEAPSNLTDEQKKAAKEAADREERRKRLLGQIEDAERKVEDSSLATADAARNLNDATDNLNTAQGEQERLLRDGTLTDEKKAASLDTITAAQGRLYDANETVSTARQAQQTLLADSIATDDEKRIALGNVRQAQIDLAREVQNEAEVFATQQGATEGTTTAFQLQRNELLDLMAVYPQIRNEIQSYIDKLGEIPGVATTQLVATAHGFTTKQTLGAGGRLVGGAEGAIVNRPTLAWIGEGSHSEALIPLGSTPGNSPLSSAMFGGGNTYVDFHLHVGGALVHESDLERLFVETLRSAERRGATMPWN